MTDYERELGSIETAILTLIEASKTCVHEGARIFLDHAVVRLCQRRDGLFDEHFREPKALTPQIWDTQADKLLQRQWWEAPRGLGL